MLGKTHFTIGIASALAVAHPTSIPEILIGVIAGGIGGRLPDIDLKKGDITREQVYDSIIDSLFISAVLAVDYIAGSGICQYVLDNVGWRLWTGLTILLLVVMGGLKSAHRSFTHSILGWALSTIGVYLFCAPATVPFIVGYGSHLFLDIFNHGTMRLFYPSQKGYSFKKCYAKGTVNTVLYWIGLASTIVICCLQISSIVMNGPLYLPPNNILTSPGILGLNFLQSYLVIINLITFCGFQRSWEKSDREIKAETSKTVRIQLEFETWVLDFMAFIGGGIGMFTALLIHGAFPCGYNGNWWSICYTSILGWFTIYCYICNPFGYTFHKMDWDNMRHIFLFSYLLLINIANGLLFYRNRKKHLNEYNPIHTLLWIMGALGGTIFPYPIVLASHRDQSFNYAVFGFPLMILSQVAVISYFISAGIF